MLSPGSSLCAGPVLVTGVLPLPIDVVRNSPSHANWLVTPVKREIKTDKEISYKIILETRLGRLKEF